MKRRLHGVNLDDGVALSTTDEPEAIFSVRETMHDGFEYLERDTGTGTHGYGGQGYAKPNDGGGSFEEHDCRS